MMSISSRSGRFPPPGTVTLISRSASSTPNEKAEARLPPPEKVTTTKSSSEFSRTPGASFGVDTFTTSRSGCSRGSGALQAASSAATQAVATAVFGWRWVKASPYAANAEVYGAEVGGWMSVSFVSALRVWLKIGLLGFGGPAGQIALMHRELVEK